jgi:rubrerythrin
MEMEDTVIIAIQSLLGRTHAGRHINPEAMKVLAQPHDTHREIVECPNCGFIFGSSWFINGCPNCNSREASGE